MASATIFTDYLRTLGVRHTRRYSDSRFRSMTFRSLFGLSRLLDDYGIANTAWRVPRTGSLDQLPVPFLAQKPGNFVIVTDVSPAAVDYIYQGERKRMSVPDFEKNWTGVVLLAKGADTACEPDYTRHRILDFARGALTWIMLVSIAVVMAYLYVSRGFYDSVAATLLIVVDVCGLAVTSMLMLKSLNVHTAAADRVCGVLQRGGCDKILATDASRFFGLFGWSEVGLAYFGVSTAALLLFPGYIHYLALANLCCLPFTVWSIWYQKFRAHHWCTLCDLTQTLLWCQFFCYAAGGFERDFTLASPYPWILLCCYVAAVLLLNKFAELMNASKS